MPQYSFDAQLNENNEFVFLIPISEPQFVALSYGPNVWVRLYVEPGNHIQLDADAKNFERSVYFKGDLNGNNTKKGRCIMKSHRIFMAKFSY